MARRRMARRRGSRRKVVWDTITEVQANLPLLTLDSVNGGVDGAFTSLQRWRGSDVTLLRTIFQTMVRIEQADFQVDQTAVLEICVGLSFFDSMGDVTGQAFNTTIATGTGPLTDADNSRWFARCCVLIPTGSFNAFGSTENLVFPVTGARAGPSSSYWFVQGGGTPAAQTSRFYCEWDSKTKRKAQGAETEWIQCAMEAKVSVVPTAGDDITVAMDAFSGRVVKTMGGVADV